MEESVLLQIYNRDRLGVNVFVTSLTCADGFSSWFTDSDHRVNVAHWPVPVLVLRRPRLTTRYQWRISWTTTTRYVQNLVASPLVRTSDQSILEVDKSQPQMRRLLPVPMLEYLVPVIFSLSTRSIPRRCRWVTLEIYRRASVRKILALSGRS